MTHHPRWSLVCTFGRQRGIQLPCACTFPSHPLSWVRGLIPVFTAFQVDDNHLLLFSLQLSNSPPSSCKLGSDNHYGVVNFALFTIQVAGAQLFMLFVILGANLFTMSGTAMFDRGLGCTVHVYLFSFSSFFLTQQKSTTRALARNALIGIRVLDSVGGGVSIVTIYYQNSIYYSSFNKVVFFFFFFLFRLMVYSLSQQPSSLPLCFPFPLLPGHFCKLGENDSAFLFFWWT